MEWYNVVELICTVISTLSIIFSSIVLGYYFFYKMSVTTLYENNFLSIYVYAYQRNIKLTKWQVYCNKKLLNPDDIFFSNGESSIALNKEENSLIKHLNIDLKEKKFLTIVLYTENGKKIKRRCYVRRIYK